MRDNWILTLYLPTYIIIYTFSHTIINLIELKFVVLFFYSPYYYYILFTSLV